MIGSAQVFIIYRQPSCYVVRRQVVTRIGMLDDLNCELVDTLDQARALVPPGFMPVSNPRDDPRIVETWI